MFKIKLIELIKLLQSILWIIESRDKFIVVIILQQWSIPAESYLFQIIDNSKLPLSMFYPSWWSY